MQTNQQRLNILRTYIILGFVGCLACFHALFRFSLGEESQARSWVLAFPALFSVLFLCLVVLTLRRSSADKLLRFTKRFLSGRVGYTAAFLALFYTFIISLIYSLSASSKLYGPVYPVWLVPFFLWLVWISGLALVFIVIWRFGASWTVLISLLVVIAILVMGIAVSLQFWGYESPRKEDIYYTYLDGERLLQGVNPYERVLAGDMRVNDKYSTYFPGFYYLASLVQFAGLRVFDTWLSFWRVIFLVFNISIAALLFYIPARKQMLGLSIFAALFWLFNRWTLHVARTADIDFIPLFFMLLSLYLFQRNRKTSYLLLGLSLTIKQVAIFLVPVYLIWSWKKAPDRSAKHLVSSALWIGIVPLIASLPLLIWNWEAFVRSILFSTTRIAAAAYNVYSLDVALGWQGLLARVPVVLMLLMAYWLTWKYKLGVFNMALLVLAIFLFFNSVFFTSYMVWVVAFIPLTAYELIAHIGGNHYELPG
jgi:hypothetical protein